MLPGVSGSLTDDMIDKLLQEQKPAAPEAVTLELLAHELGINELRQAAVLAPLVWFNHQWSLLFTRRTETVNNHKGQVSFPGGAAEPEDRSPEDTALREAYEEIGLRPEDVLVYGRLASRPTVSSFLVTPVVGRVRWPVELYISPHEVGRVFTIPLDWLADPANREERPRTLPTGRTIDVIYYQIYDDELLWGATARITLDLLKALHLVK
jgi:8-oxo-dGTP pyrophosphatase MutT (NUDIX family)